MPEKLNTVKVLTKVLTDKRETQMQMVEIN